MNRPEIPAKIHDTTRVLLDNGWAFMVQHGQDSVGHRFVSIKAQRDRESPELHATWHTRPTEGERYRWWSGIYAGRDVSSLTKLQTIITEAL